MEVIPVLVFAVVLYYYVWQPARQAWKRWRNPPAPLSKPAADFPVDVVGESFYQDNLERLCGGKRFDGVSLTFLADIIPDNNNEHDPNAVRVDIADQTVGHLSRADAKVYRTAFDAKPTRCSALVTGGWKRGKNDEGHYGVKLKLDIR